jgi:short-subunit dehydrogenase
VLPILRQQRSGTIVNMSSVMGRKAFARFGSYAIVMHGVSAFSDALRQELAGNNIRVSVIHPALTATDFLIDVDAAELPPPFRHMTPVSSEEVARSVVAAVRRGTRRVVLPRPANFLLLGEALSPRIGDLIASALTRRPVARLVGMSRGTTYHDTIVSRHGSRQRNLAAATTQTSVK